MLRSFKILLESAETVKHKFKNKPCSLQLRHLSYFHLCPDHRVMIRNPMSKVRTVMEKGPNKLDSQFLLSLHNHLVCWLINHSLTKEIQFDTKFNFDLKHVQHFFDFEY